jgi:hypothetical protein
MDKRDAQILRLQADLRRQHQVHANYEQLANGVNSLWATWRSSSSQGETEEHVTGALEALTDPMEILPALARCFTVHTDAEASARYVRQITGCINTLWRRNFSDVLSIKSQPVKVPSQSQCTTRLAHAFLVWSHS